jgi:hypothetical protein
MKTISRGMWLLAAVGLLAVSCMVKEPEQDAMMTDAPKITAMVGTGGAATKVSVTETDGQTRQTFWEKGDEIAVFMHNGRALRYALEGEGGESSGVFSYVSGNGLGLEFPQVYGVYPYCKGIVLDGARVQMDFPGEQAYTADAFDPKANLMVAASESNDLYFQNVGGYLVLELYGADIQVEKVVVKGNAGEPLSGPATIWVYEDDTPEIEIAEETAGKSVTLKCASPVTVGATESDATAFWFVLPPTWFGEGLTVTVFGPDGGTFTRSATGSIDLGRSEVYRLTTEVEMEHLNGHEYVEMAPGLKIATCNVGATTPEELGDAFNWGETEPSLSLESTWEDYKWFDATATDWYVYNAAYGRLTKYATWMYHTEDGWYTYELVDAGDHLTRLEPEDDAATVNWGGDWRMPTVAQMEYLTGNDFSWTKVTREDAEGNEVAGYEVVSQVPGFEGNTVFFPAMFDEDGEYVYYWTADVSYSYYSNSAYCLRSDYVDDSYYRRNPFSVRPFLVVPVETMTLSQTSMEVPEAASFSLSFDFTPVYASDRLTWSSSDESVATVRQDGYVTAVAPGTAEIVVTAESGVSASCALTVTSQVELFGKQWTYTDEEGGKILDLRYTYETRNILATVGETDGMNYFTGPNATFDPTLNNDWPKITMDDEGNFYYDVATCTFVNPTATSSLIRFNSGKEYTATLLDPAVELTYVCPQLTFGETNHEMRTSTSSEYGVNSRFKFWDEVMGRKTSVTLPIIVLTDADGNMAYGLEEDFEGLDLTGKIVVVSRGSVRFDAKANLAAEAGAAAILIVNNQEDDGMGMDMSQLSYEIPYFLVQLDCYDLLMESEEATFTLGTLEEYVP